MKRLYQIMFIGTFIGFSWLAMQCFHELGHVIGARLGGGTVVNVVLHPFTISRTDVFPNPYICGTDSVPHSDWAGPMAGSAARLPSFPWGFLPPSWELKW